MSGSRIAVFGAGYAGLVTGACFAELGHSVAIRDIVPEKIAALNAGRASDLRAGPRRAGRAKPGAARFTLDAAEAVEGSQFVFICVDTPPDLCGRRRPFARVDGDRGAAARLGADDPGDEEHRACRDGRDDPSEPRRARARAVSDTCRTPSSSPREPRSRTFSSPIGSSSALSRRPMPRRSKGSTPVSMHRSSRTDVASAEMIKLASNAFLGTRDQLHQRDRQRVRARRERTSPTLPEGWAWTRASARATSSPGSGSVVVV